MASSSKVINVNPRRNAAGAHKEAERLFAEYANGGSFLSTGQLHGIMKAQGFLPQEQRTGDGRRAVVGALADMGVSGSTIPRQAFCKWFVRQKCEFVGSALNRLLVKDRLGKCKTSSYQLPGGSMVYGQRNSWDKEGAGAVALKWVEGKRSKSRSHGKRDIIAENRASASAGAINARENAAFRAANPKFVQKRQISRASRQTNPYAHDEQLLYGKVSAKSMPVKKLLNAKIAGTSDSNYPDMSNQVVPGRIPRPRPTHSSELLANQQRAAREEARSGKKQEVFKMKKFKRVPAKVTRYLRKSEAAAPAQDDGASPEVA
eukprot:g2780.t1